MLWSTSCASSTRFPNPRDRPLASPPVSRRLSTLIAVALVMVLSTGCANDGAVALRVGDTEIGISEFQDELADWAASPTLVSQVGISSSVGGAPG